MIRTMTNKIVRFDSETKLCANNFICWNFLTNPTKINKTHKNKLLESEYICPTKIDGYTTDKLLEIMFKYFNDYSAIATLAFRSLINKSKITIYLTENDKKINTDIFELNDDIHHICLNIIINDNYFFLKDIYIRKYFDENNQTIYLKDSEIDSDSRSYFFDKDGFLTINHNKLSVNYNKILLFQIIKQISYCDVYLNGYQKIKNYIKSVFKYSIYGIGLYFLTVNCGKLIHLI
jgi:hypothetical protein